MLNRKPYSENHKNLAESKLAARFEILKSKGMTAEQIKRDGTVKHFRAEMRKAKNQLAEIAKLELQIAQKTETKAKKLAASKVQPPKHKSSDADLEKKRAKKEKKAAAAKAETEK